jgi:hypothetical protein
VERRRPLTKREVEALLAAVAEPARGTGSGDADVAVEVAALVAALHGPLARAVGVPATRSWGDLVDAAAAVGGWDDARTTAVRATAADERVRAALEDLVAELNELRGLDRPT